MGRIVVMLIALMLLGAAAPAAAQWVNPDTCSWAEFSCQQANKERDEKNAANDNQRAEVRLSPGQRVREFIKSPPLAAQRNLLLGTWRPDDAQQSRATGIGLLDAIIAPELQGRCRRYFGSGITFTANTYSISGFSRPIGGSISYRSAGPRAVVAIVTRDHDASMLFRFSSPNKMVSDFDGCALVRIGPPAAGAQEKAATMVGAGGSRSIGTGGIANSGVNFGTSIGAVRQTLAGRQVDLMPAMNHGNWHTLVASGGFPEIDPRVIRLSYQFDAPEGPSAKLIGVVVTYARDGSAQSAVYSERASALSKRYPLVAKSPGKMEASVPGMVVTLVDDPNFSQLHELYQKR